MNINLHPRGSHNFIHLALPTTSILLSPNQPSYLPNLIPPPFLSRTFIPCRYSLCSPKFLILLSETHPPCSSSFIPLPLQEPHPPCSPNLTLDLSISPLLSQLHQPYFANVIQFAFLTMLHRIIKFSDLYSSYSTSILK